MARFPIAICLILVLIASSSVYEAQGTFLLRHYMSKFPKVSNDFEPFAYKGMLSFVDNLESMCPSKGEYKDFFSKLKGFISFLNTASGSSSEFQSQLKAQCESLFKAINALGIKAGSADTSKLIETLTSMGKTFAEYKQSGSQTMTSEQRRQLVTSMVTWAQVIGQFVKNVSDKSGDGQNVDLASILGGIISGGGSPSSYNDSPSTSSYSPPSNEPGSPYSTSSPSNKPGSPYSTSPSEFGSLPYLGSQNSVSSAEDESYASSPSSTEDGGDGSTSDDGMNGMGSSATSRTPSSSGASCQNSTGGNASEGSSYKSGAAPTGNGASSYDAPTIQRFDEEVSAGGISGETREDAMARMFGDSKEKTYSKSTSKTSPYGHSSKQNNSRNTNSSSKSSPYGHSSKQNNSRNTNS